MGTETEARWPVRCLAAAVNEGGERAARVMQVTVLVDSRLDVSTALLWVSERLAYFAAAWMSTDRWMNSLPTNETNQSANYGRPLVRIAIPAFDRIAELDNRLYR